MNKKITMLMMVILIFMMGGTKSLADEEGVSYNLQKNEKEESFKVVENDEVIDITIVEDAITSRLADKSYTVTKSKSGSWSISYKVSVKSNKIKSAYGGLFKVSKGSFSKQSASRLSKSSAVGKVS